MEEYIYTNKKMNNINQKNNKKRKTKNKIFKFLIIFIVIIFIILASVIYFNKKHEEYLYSLTYEYKLNNHGYDTSTTKLLQEKLNEEELNTLLNKPVIKAIDKMINDKYFIFNKLDRYEINYDYTDLDFDVSNMIKEVNVNKDISPFTNEKEVDISKGYELLVNGYYKLDKNYKSDNLVRISNMYCFTEMYIDGKVYEAYKKMYKDALNDGIKFLITSAYRSYDSQVKVFDEYRKTKGEDYAEKYVAIPGYSEHQTGLALDIFTYGSTMASFENTKGFKWLKDNSYKYGFILRYTKDLQNLLGTTYESWHYRYVGVETATKIYNENITFEEYYSYYVEK